MSVSDLNARVNAIRDLAGRVFTALDYSQLLAKGALPNVTPAAFVIPLGFNARDKGSASANAFIQNFEEVFAIVLVMRTSGDVSGSRAQPQLEALVGCIIEAVAGQGPETEPGVYALRRARLVGMNAGTIFHQTEFSIHKQLRIVS